MSRKIHPRSPHEEPQFVPEEPRAGCSSFTLDHSIIMDVTEPQVSCGWQKWRPKFLQRFATAKWFLFIHCCFVLTQGMVVTGLAGVVVSTIEKRFYLKSREVGGIQSCYDAAASAMAIVVSYYGHNHKPKWIGFGAIIMALGCLTFALPQALTPYYNPGPTEDVDVCLNHIINNSTNSTLPPQIQTCRDSQWYILLVFVLAEFLIGFGATPVYTLGTAFIDENVRRENSGVYLGIMYAVASIGPAVGYLLGGQFLNIYVDITQPEGQNLTPSDSSFVGAWWLGYIFGGCLALFWSLPMLAFPKELPGTNAIRKEKQMMSDIVEDDRLPHTLSELLPTIKSLLTNKTFVFTSLGAAAEGLVVSGMSTFLPKFIEKQFRVSASSASIYTGLVVVPGGCGGMLLGGYLIKKRKWTCLQTARACFFIACIAFVASAVLMIGCPSREIAGATVLLPNSQSDSFNLIEQCNADCNCDRGFYHPICTMEDQLTYFSPCHAGCSIIEFVDGQKVYRNCSCFPNNIKEATYGGCVPYCNTIYPFLVGLLVLMILTFLNNIPATTVTLRCVKESQGSFALGVQQLFVRLLGFIPGPILFGTVIDISCVLWEEDECDSSATRNCLEYSNQKFRYFLLIAGVFFKLWSVIFFYIAWKTYHPPSGPATDVQSNSSAEVQDASTVYALDNEAITPPNEKDIEDEFPVIEMRNIPKGHQKGVDNMALGTPQL